MEEQAQREEILISEVETDEEERDSGDEGGDDNDDRFFLNF